MKHPNTRHTILIASHDANLRGGSEKSLLRLAIYLKKQGYNVHIIVPEEGQLSRALVKNNIVFHKLPIPWWGHVEKFSHDTLMKTFTDAIPCLVELISEIDPTICITNTSVIPTLAYAANICNVQHVWIVREHGDNIEFLYDTERIRKTIRELSSYIFFNSEHLRDVFTTKLEFPRTGIVYPEISIPKLDKNIVSPFKKTSRIRLCIVGYVSPEKGQLEAVEAVAKLRKTYEGVELLIVGSGEEAYTKKITKYIADNELSGNVKFTGYIKNPANIVHFADIVLTCSKNEAFGRVTVEGMLAKKISIGSNSGGTKDIIRDGETGLLYQVGSVEDLIKKIEFCVHHQSKVQKMAIAGYNEAMKYTDGSFCYSDLTSFLNKVSPNNFKSMTLSVLKNDLLNLRTSQRVIGDQKEKINTLTDQLENMSLQLNSIKNSKAYKLYIRTRRFLRFIF